MKKIITSLFFLLFLSCGYARAQQGVSANLSASDSGACTTANACLILNVAINTGGATFGITANASGNTIQFEATADNGASWVALSVTPSNSTTTVTSSNGTGAWQANVAGFTAIRMRMSTLVSGSTTANMNPSTASARAGGGGGGVSGTMPTGAGLTKTVSGTFGYDTTNNNVHFGVNGTDYLGVLTPTGTPTQGHLGYWSVSGSQVSLLDIAPTGGTVAGGQLPLFCTITNGSTGDVFGLNGSGVCVNNTLGIPITAVTSTPVAIASANRGNLYKLGSGAVALTINAAGSAGFGSNFQVPIWSINPAGAVSVTPTTSTITGGCNNVSAGSAANMDIGAYGQLFSDNSNYFLTCLISPWSTDVLTNKTFDSAVNVLKLAGITITGVQGNGAKAQLSTGAVTTNVVAKFDANGNTINSSMTDNATSVTTTDTGGYVAPVFVSNGSTAGFADFPQGTTSSAVAPCNAATSICEQAPTAVTSYLVTKPGAAPNIASYKQTDGCAAASCTESFHPVPVLLTVASDFTDSTSTTLQLITGLSATMPVSKAVVISAHCALLFDQATAAVSDSFGIGVTGTAPTQANASGTVFTSSSVQATGTLTALASTTPTAVVTFTPSAITTIWKAELDATIEQPSNATPGVFGIYVSTTTGTDNFIVKRGSYCSVIYQ